MEPAGAQPQSTLAMLRHERHELAKRASELAVAEAELQALREGRRTYLRQGQLLFRLPVQAVQQAVAGEASSQHELRQTRGRAKAAENPARAHAGLCCVCAQAIQRLSTRDARQSPLSLSRSLWSGS